MKKSVTFLLLWCLLLASLRTLKPDSVFAEYSGGRQTLRSSGSASADEGIWLSAHATDRSSQVAFTTKIISSTSVEIEITFPGIWAEAHNSPQGDFTRLSLEQYGHDAPDGHPDLPLYILKTEISFSGAASLEILESSSRTILLAEQNLPQIIYPVQPLAPKSYFIPPWVEPDPDAYQSQQFLPAQTVYLGTSYQQRNYRIQPIRIHPVRYQPQEGAIQLLETLKLRLSWQAPTPAELQQAGRLADPAFDALQEDELITTQANLAADKSPTAGSRYLIISPDIFLNTLAPFVNFKQSQGYQVTLASLSDVGSSTLTGIKRYIQKAYDTWETPPSYLLLVGDSNLIPAWSRIDNETMKIAKKTDLYYVTMNGSNDFDPDIFYGRFSVRDIPQLNNIINKTIAYANLNGSQAWVKKAAFIASCDSSYYGTAEATQNYVITSYGLPLGYSGTFPSNPQPGGDQLYCHSPIYATTTDVIASVNDQRSFVAYSGHGSTDRWSDGGITFTSNNVRDLVTNNVFSLITSFACLTGDFGNDAVLESFGETWLRQAQKGAIVYLGSADNSFWDPDDVLERAFYDSFFATPSNPPKIAQPVYDGLDEVRDHYPSTAQYYFESYNILGDPSAQIWLQPRSSDFALQMENNSVDVCTGAGTQSSVNVISVAGFSEPVTLNLVSLPSDSSYTLSVNPVNPGSNTDLTISAEAGSVPATYDVTLQGTTASLQHTVPFKLSISNVVPAIPTLLLPEQAGSPYPLNPSFTWQPVTQASGYHFQLALDSEFTKIIIDEPDLNAAAFTPASPLDSATVYYWRVSANNGCGQSNFSIANTFYTLSLAGDCVSAAQTRTQYFNDFESSASDWTSSTWGLSTDRFLSPQRSFHASAPNTSSEQSLISPALPIPNAVMEPSLQFWQWRNLEDQASGCLDGGILEYSTNGGSSWAQVPSLWFPTVSEGYDGLIASNYSNPLAGKLGWCGDEDWQRSVVDLTALAGETASFRYRLGTDNYLGSNGWFVDDFSIRYCQEDYNFTLNTAQAEKNGEAGTQAEYSIQITNAGSRDSYQIALSASNWDTTVSSNLIENLDFLQTGTLTVQVTIPPVAVLGQQDNVTITVTSVNQPTLQHSLTLTTTVIQNYYSYLPLILTQ